MKKIITFFVLIISFFMFSYSYWIESESWILEDIFQESINKNFKPIDKKIEEYLINLNTSKNYCFWKDRQMTFVECVDYIEKIFSINSDEFVMWEGWYANACEKSLIETIEKQEDKTISAMDAKTILDRNWNNKSCHELYSVKLAIYKSVAYDILKNNKYAVLKDEHKLYTQENRERYEYLLTSIRVNISYIERLWKKWPSKTK